MNKAILQILGVWGCLAKMTVPPPKKVNIGPKTIDCIFIGYAHTSAAYQFLVHELNISDIHKNTIMESRNASFFEDVFSCKSKVELIHQNELLRLLMEIIKMKMIMVRLNLDAVREQG